jgi:hypothetical protein
MFTTHASLLVADVVQICGTGSGTQTVTFKTPDCWHELRDTGLIKALHQPAIAKFPRCFAKTAHHDGSGWQQLRCLTRRFTRIQVVAISGSGRRIAGLSE